MLVAVVVVEKMQQGYMLRVSIPCLVFLLLPLSNLCPLSFTLSQGTLSCLLTYHSQNPVLFQNHLIPTGLLIYLWAGQEAMCAAW